MMQTGEDLLRPAKKLRISEDGAPEALLIPGVDMVDDFGDALDGDFGLDNSPRANSSDCMMQMLCGQFSPPDLGDKQYGAQPREAQHGAGHQALLPSPLPPVNGPSIALAADIAPQPGNASRTSPPTLIPTTRDAIAAMAVHRMGSRPTVSAFIPTPNVGPALAVPLIPEASTQPALHHPLASGDALLRPEASGRYRSPADAASQPSRSWSGGVASYQQTDSTLTHTRHPHGSLVYDPARTASASRLGCIVRTTSLPGGGGAGAGGGTASSSGGGGAAPTAHQLGAIESRQGCQLGGGGGGSAAGASGRGGEQMGQTAHGRPGSHKEVNGTSQPRQRGGPKPPSAKNPPGSAASSRSLLLRAFNGLMRPEVAPLAVAAAQRACVTDPTVPSGLYYTAARQVAPAAPLAAAAGSKRGGKDRQAAPGGSAVLAADPFKLLYPEANAELLAALYGTRQAPQRVRVEPILDRCHPCFRNPFEGLAAVAERRKVVATGPIPDGRLLGLYMGELRSGRLDDRIVGGDLSGLEGLKAGFTLMLLGELEVAQPAAAGSSSAASLSGAALGRGGPAGDGGVATGPDCLVMVGDPAACDMAEANAPRFWGPCAKLPPGAVTAVNRTACNCKAYRDREANAAVIPCILKIKLCQLRQAVEAEGNREELREGLEVLRKAAELVKGAGGGGGGLDDGDTYVYGIVVAVVTSDSLREGEEVLLRWDFDDSFFAVADQNLRQYVHINKVATERDEAEKKHVENLQKLAVLRAAHKETQAARELALQQRDEAVRQRDEAVRQCDEAVRQRDETVRQRDETVRQRDETVRQLEETVRQQRDDALQQRDDALQQRDDADRRAAEAERQRDEALEEVRSKRTAAAALAAAAGPRVAALEGVVAQLQAERDDLRAQVQELQDRLQQQDQRHQAPQQHPSQRHSQACEHRQAEEPHPGHHVPHALPQPQPRWRAPGPGGQEPLHGFGVQRQGSGVLYGSTADGLSPRSSGRLEQPPPPPPPSPPPPAAPSAAAAAAAPGVSPTAAPLAAPQAGSAASPSDAAIAAAPHGPSSSARGSGGPLEQRLRSSRTLATLGSVLGGGGSGGSSDEAASPSALLRRYEEGRRLADEAVLALAAALMEGGHAEGPVQQQQWQALTTRLQEELATTRGRVQGQRNQTCTTATTAVRQRGERPSGLERPRVDSRPQVTQPWLGPQPAHISLGDPPAPAEGEAGMEPGAGLGAGTGLEAQTGAATRPADAVYGGFPST